jgi:hypothetical protein
MKIGALTAPIFGLCRVKTRTSVYVNTLDSKTGYVLTSNRQMGTLYVPDHAIHYWQMQVPLSK